nr:hypothetical protein [Tanacetum cinerariifolium]
MAPLTFVDMHNMVVFLSKSNASEGFDQIMDFLNAHTIQYALVVNLPSMSHVVVSEDIIHKDLNLDDANGVECLPNEEIFEALARIDYEKPPPKLTFYKAFFYVQWKFLIHTLVQCLSAKKTAWNEFSCSMTSAVICLATGGCIQIGGNIEAIDPNEDITLVDIEKDEEVVTMDAEPQRRIAQKEVNAASKGVKVVEPTVFDDEVVTMIMAQTLIKIKAEKAKLLDEQIAQKLHDEEYDDKEENIDWNVVTEQIQEKHLDNIKKYQSLEKKLVSIAQARKNMIIYLKNMVGYKIEHFRGMNYDKVRPIFEREYKKVQTLFKPDKDVEKPKMKRVADETLLQESFKKLKAAEVSVSEFKVEALQVKYPIIDWEIHIEGLRTYWKIIRVGGIIMAYQSFEDNSKDLTEKTWLLYEIW